MNGPRRRSDAVQAEETRREFARAMDCLTSEELRFSAGITEKTEEAWRKRGLVDYVLFGNRYYYPKKKLADRLGSMMREARSVCAKDVL